MQVVFDQVFVTGSDAKFVCQSARDNELIDFTQVKIITSFTVDNSRTDLATDYLIIKLEIMSL